MKNNQQKTTHPMVLTAAAVLTVFSIIGSVMAAGVVPMGDFVNKVTNDSSSDKPSQSKGDDNNPVQQPSELQRLDHEADDNRSYSRQEFMLAEHKHPRAFDSVVKPRLSDCYNCGVVIGIESFPQDESLLLSDQLDRYLDAHQENARIITLENATTSAGHRGSADTSTMAQTDGGDITYVIKVKMYDGRQHAIYQNTPPTHNIGDKVRLTVGRSVNA